MVDKHLSTQFDAELSGISTRVLEMGGMREWYAAALRETMRDEPHDAELAQFGSVLEDLRARP